MEMVQSRCSNCLKEEIKKILIDGAEERRKGILGENMKEFQMGSKLEFYTSHDVQKNSLNCTYDTNSDVNWLRE